ncbi:MAG: polyhydroxyalkanoate granule-associated phasin [Burkholderiaceae bacterium]
MSYFGNKNPVLNPFLAWSELAIKTGEMMVASAQVIQHRTGRMAASGATPSLRDQREFRLMGEEKLEAITESAQAMALQMMTMNPILGMHAFELMMKVSTAMLSLATSTTLGQSLSHQAKLAKVWTESANANSELSNSAFTIAHHGLKPIHSRATLNAKRLSEI